MPGHGGLWPIPLISLCLRLSLSLQPSRLTGRSGGDVRYCNTKSQTREKLTPLGCGSRVRDTTMRQTRHLATSTARLAVPHHCESRTCRLHSAQTTRAWRVDQSTQRLRSPPASALGARGRLSRVARRGERDLARSCGVSASSPTRNHPAPRAQSSIISSSCNAREASRASAARRYGAPAAAAAGAPAPLIRTAAHRSSLSLRRCGSVASSPA